MRERPGGGVGGLRDLMMALPGANLQVAINAAVDLAHAPCYLDLESLPPQ